MTDTERAFQLQKEIAERQAELEKLINPRPAPWAGPKPIEAGIPLSTPNRELINLIQLNGLDVSEIAREYEMTEKSFRRLLERELNGNEQHGVRVIIDRMIFERQFQARG
jgi:hypothetical protein